MFIHGITVTLYDRVKTGMDLFNAPVYSGVAEQVENVLVAPAIQGGQDVIDQQQLYGKRAEYILAIPKGDTHDWKDKTVGFFGEKFRVFGYPSQGIEENMPLSWNKKVLVERYE